MKIGILQTGHLPEDIQARIGDYPVLYARLLKDQGLDLQTWAVVDMEFPKSVHDADGWLVTGSRHGAYEDHPWIAPLEEFIREAYAADVPLVGVCFGHQIIAQALGGKVAKFEGGWAVGPHDYDFGGDRVTLNAWHQDQVIEAPKGARRIATSPFCENAALVYDKKAFTVQAHPEFDREAVELLMKIRGPGVIPDPVLEDAAQSLGRPVANAQLAKQIGDFFKEARHG